MMILNLEEFVCEMLPTPRALVLKAWFSLGESLEGDWATRTLPSSLAQSTDTSITLWHYWELLETCRGLSLEETGQWVFGVCLSVGSLLSLLAS